VTSRFIYRAINSWVASKPLADQLLGYWIV